MSKNYLDALASERGHNTMLRKAILLVCALAGLGMYLTYSLPKHMTLHLAPNLEGGETVDVQSGTSPVPAVNVYGFSYYIWQQINRWQTDGLKDYGSQIYIFQHYLTPRCHAQLQADMDNRSKKGELRERTRFITEIPGFSYAANRVQVDGQSAWNVLLDMQVSESYRGHAIKDVFIRYPLRVVRFDVDREKNPWRLALDCFGTNRPARLDPQDIQAKRVPDTSTAIVPAVLPRTTDQSIDARELKPSPLEVPAPPIHSAPARPGTSVPAPAPATP